jgi:antitoxin Phd
MRSWPVQDAKARFSEMLETCMRDGPQMVTKRGEEVAVVVPLHEWEMMKKAERPSLKDVLLTSASKYELEIPKRGKLNWRVPPDLE